MLRVRIELEDQYLPKTEGAKEFRDSFLDWLEASGFGKYQIFQVENVIEGKIEEGIGNAEELELKIKEYVIVKEVVVIQE